MSDAVRSVPPGADRRRAPRYSDLLVPADRRVGRWSLGMAWWALFSAMFWIYVGVASAQSVGVPSTLIGMALTIATYGAVNAVLARRAARTGATVSLWSLSLLGRSGSVLATLIFAATAIYYAVFEGSVIAVALQSWFGGPLNLWYAVVVAYALPLAAGNVHNWLDKLNGWLLPLYVAGLVAAVVSATVQRGYPSGWLSLPGTSTSALPGWLSSYLIYMGVWIMMMYTVDYATMGRNRDEGFHRQVTFGWVFYLFTFGFNGLIGIYLLTAYGITGSETGVVEAVLSALGPAGLVVIIVSQTRINTANYFLASANLTELGARLGLRRSRTFWLVVAGVIAFAFMLTDVLSYLLTALAWQGVFVTAWVAIALVEIAATRRRAVPVPETSLSSLPKFSPGLVAWIVSAVVGIGLTEQDASSTLAALAPLVTVVLAATLFAVGRTLQRPPLVEPVSG